LALPAVQAEVQVVRTGRRQAGLRPGQPEWPGQACPQTGADPAAAAPVETRSSKLLSGEP
jgi:hypothetical protein